MFVLLLLHYKMRRVIENVEHSHLMVFPIMETKLYLNKNKEHFRLFCLVYFRKFSTPRGTPGLI